MKEEAQKKYADLEAQFERELAEFDQNNGGGAPAAAAKAPEKKAPVKVRYVFWCAVCRMSRSDNVAVLRLLKTRSSPP